MEKLGMPAKTREQLNSWKTKPPILGQKSDPKMGPVTMDPNIEPKD